MFDRLTVIIFCYGLTLSAAVKPVVPFSQSHILTVGNYMQSRDDNKKNDQTVDLALSSAYTFQEFLKATSYFYYYYSYSSPSNSDFDDPVLTLTTLPKNVIPAVKMRFYSIANLGLSKWSRDTLKQYGTIGLGAGAALDTKYLRLSSFDLSGTVSFNKNLVESEETAAGESNNNYYMAYGTTGSYSYSKWTLVIHFMFFQYFKYVSDESSETLYQFQDIGYQFNPKQNVGFGHSNRMGFYDDNSGSPKLRLFNSSSSYFYVRYTHTF